MPYTWFDYLDGYPDFLCGLNFTSRNLLDSATGGTFMSTTLGASTKLLDEMMNNYSQWHTERAPTGRKAALTATPAAPMLRLRTPPPSEGEPSRQRCRVSFALTSMIHIVSSYSE